jgi:hypothetical protein
MKNRMAPAISVAIVFFAAVATVALRAAARRPGPRPVPGTESAPVTVTADESRPRTAVTTCAQDSAVEQMQHVFHELHPDGRHALCAVCDGQYR